MKKSSLLLASLALSLAVSAQTGNSSAVRLNTKDASSNLPEAVHNSMVTRSQGDPGKTSAVKSRLYNYVDHLNIFNSAIISSGDYDNYPYMWFNNDIKSIYGNGSGGVQADTVKLTSIGSVMHPFWSGYNTSPAYAKGTMVLTATNAYMLDSVSFYGIYGRNSTRTTPIDTLRISITYGNGSNTSNLPSYYYTGMTANYGTDTVRSIIPSFDLVRHIMYKPTASTGPAILVKDIYLRSTDTSSQVKEFRVFAGLSVPAGNYVAATITFRSGDAYVPNDTAYRGSVNPTEPFKYGLFRPLIFEQSLTAFPTYTKGNYNSGQFEQLPEPDPQTTATYSPNWAWTTANGTSPSIYQFPYVDFKITCISCSNLSVADAANVVSIGAAYPNPANSQITLPITMKESAAINATLSNMVGQVMATQNLGTLSAQQSKKVTFNTSNLAAGIYLVTIEANGQRITKRISVTH